MLPTSKGLRLCHHGSTVPLFAEATRGCAGPRTHGPGRQEEHRLLLTVGSHQPLSGRSRRAYTPSIEGVTRCGTFASIRPSEVANERERRTRNDQDGCAGPP